MPLGNLLDACLVAWFGQSCVAIVLTLDYLVFTVLVSVLARSGYRVWFQRRFLRRLYIVLTSFFLLPSTISATQRITLHRVIPTLANYIQIIWLAIWLGPIGAHSGGRRRKTEEGGKERRRRTLWNHINYCKWVLQWSRWLAGKPLRHDLGVTFENSGALRKSTVGMIWACCTGSTRSEVNRNWHVDSAGFECSCSRCNLEAEKVLLGPSFCLVGNFCANPKIPKTAKKSALQCRFFATMPRPSKYLEQYIHIYIYIHYGGTVTYFLIMFVGTPLKLRGAAHSLRPPELAQRLMHVQERAAALETCHLQIFC